MRLALLMMQKDERDLLAHWLAYHSHLFGYDSLFIFDNGSSCPEVLGLLEQAGCSGAHVVYCPADFETFENKSDILGQTIRELDARDPRDFYFPMDCDEFLVLKPRFFGEPSCKRKGILRHLSSLRGGQQPLKIAGAYWNMPSMEGRFYFAKWSKVFFYRGTFQSMIKGYHRGQTAGGVTKRIETRIAYLHFHNRPFAKLLQSARGKLSGRVASFDRKDLAGYDGPGNHLIKYFLCDEHDYLEGFKERPTVKAESFRAILATHQLRYPFSGAIPSLDHLSW